MPKFIDVIKFEGNNQDLIWKHSCEDFKTGSQLIVHEGQEALFFMNGKALDLFTPGRHTLTTDNLPLIGAIVKWIAGGENPFHSEIYYINKTVQMSLKWGTDTKVRYIDPSYGIPVEIGASGEMNIAIADSKLLIEKLVGTMRGISWERETDGLTKSVHNSFKPMIATAVKSNLSAAIKANNIDIFEVDENLGKLSETLRVSISAEFEKYGLTIPQFYITNVLLPENDTNFKRMKDLHSVELHTKIAKAESVVKTAQADADADVTVAQRKVELEKQVTANEIAKLEAERELIRAQAEAQKTKLSGFAEAEVMTAKGYNQKDVIQAEVQKAYAEGLGNMTSVDGVTSDVLNLGIGIKAVETVKKQMDAVFDTTPEDKKCAKCGATLPSNAKFCLECGERVGAVQMANTVVCPACGKTVEQGKFCPECGYKFVTVCPKCGKDVAAGAKFCLECGEKL